MPTTKPAPAKPIMEPIVSNQIESGGYLQEENLLLIKFKFGGLYAYHGVPEDMLSHIMAAESPSKYLGEFVKPAFKFTRIL